MRKFLLTKLLVILSLLVAACTPAATSPKLTSITLQLGSTHQAAYGGFYAAVQNGDYAREGLEVSFVEGGTNIDAVAPLLKENAQFGVMGASAIITGRAAGQPIRALATVARRDPVVFFSLADSGITHLVDFIGKKVLVSQSLRPRLFAMLSKAGIDRNKVTLVDVGDFTALYDHTVDVASGLITRSVLAAEHDGHPVNVIYPDDYGVHFYSTTIFATDNYVAENPELVTKFLRATFQGWAEVIQNPQAVGQMIARYNPEADTALESASMIASIPYVNTGEDHIGWMRPEIWAGMLKTMQSEGEITAELDISNFYTMEFVQKIYGET